MIKKLFHIADLHFRTFKRLDESEEVCKKFLDEVKKYIEENNLIKGAEWITNLIKYVIY